MTNDTRTTLVTSAIAEVGRVFHVAPEDIRGRSRRRDYTEARHIVWALLHASTRWTYSEIGRHFERDHTTVLHGIRAMSEKLKTDEQLRSIVKTFFPAIINGTSKDAA